jgi:cellobiose phosphorylase
LPPEWGEFKIHYRFRETQYQIEVTRDTTGEVDTMRLSVDGIGQQTAAVELVDDHRMHVVLLELSDPAAASPGGKSMKTTPGAVQSSGSV